MDKEAFLGRAGTYTISGRRPIAYGRASVLWLGEREGAEQVVVKLYRDAPIVGSGAEAVTEFEQETRARAALVHPNVLPVLDWGVDESGHDQVPFVVLPYCARGDLRQFLKGRAFVPVDMGLRLLKQLAAAIDHAHVQGFLHGDIKPENVLFWRSPEHVCLSDFGASRYFPQRVDMSSHAVSGRAAGTPIYLSPEEIAGQAPTQASDIYSFALVAFEVLAGARPFDNPSAFEAMRVRISGELKSARSINPLLSSDIERAFFAALNVDPGARPPSASRFVEFLERGGATATSYKASPASETAVRAAKTKRKSLSAAQRVAVVTALIAAAASISVALINIVPKLLGRGAGTTDSTTKP